MSAVVTISLPYPPSANRLWRNIRGRTIKSAEYRTWLADVGGVIMVARCGRVSGLYRLEIRATAPDRRARDLDNLFKATSDALVSSGVIGDDSAAISVYAEWTGEVVKGGRIDVTVKAA